MTRPPVSDWEDVFGFSDDPTPGDAELLGRLARSYRSVADDAGDALPLLSGLEDNQAGEGKSMDKLRDKLGDLTEQVRKLHSSYDQAAGALDTYAHSLLDVQHKADKALEDGREAKGRLKSATEVVKAAGADIGRLDAAHHPPDDHEARASTRRALDEARAEQSSAQRHSDDAQGDLDAARALAEDARQVREEEASVAARALDDAKEESVEGYSLWDKIKKAFSLALGIISGVLGVLAMLVPGLQGVGLALSIAGFVTGATAFGINMSMSAEKGEFNVLGIVLSSIGLFLGGGAVLKGVGSIAKSVTSAVKVGGARGGISKISSGFNQFRGEFKKIPEAAGKVPRNIWISGKDFKKLPTDIVNAVKGIGSKIDDLAFLAKAARNPAGAVSSVLQNVLANGFRFPASSLRLPTLDGLRGLTHAWTRTDVAGFALGVVGLGYGPLAYTGHTTPPVHDDSYLPGTP
ncbi:DUF308 domain-containing protein [Streptomyces lydicus]|uniref:DUF308 domain-containing protein n=1 Tax=Streptomyces lydicus TaxID=47763 RepID=UPI001010FDBD|nr:DUF308 domain-containing protein [Streptomyces lydicus]MCZ1008960.1 hypothetical protein [Streptomyces lydicus]